MTIEIPGYRIEGELGRGAMGTVYLAVRESLQRQVALKVLAPSLTADESFRERFLKEGRIVAQLNHPHIVTVHDIGSHAGSFYMDLELARGGSLIDRIRTGLTQDQAVALTIDIADALAYAHRRDFVHRDVKPANILFRDDDTSLLSDFGIAKSLGNETQLTAFGMSIGTPNYMSPEQGLGQPVTPQSDLYSLGVTFYEMLTGQRPYRAESSYAVVAMHMNAPPPRLPDGLARFQQIIDRCMAKDPSQRFDSGEALIEALHQVAGLDPSSSRTFQRSSYGAATPTLRGSTGQGSALPAGSLDPNEETRVQTHMRAAAPGRARTLAWAAVGVLAALAAGGGYWFWERQLQEAPSPDPEPTLAGIALVTPEVLISRQFEALMAVATARRDLEGLSPETARHPAALADLAEKFAALTEQALVAANDSSARSMLQEALAILPESTRLLQLDQAINVPRGPVSDAQRRQIQDMLRDAEAHIRERRFTLPQGANALEMYRRVLLMDPDNGTAITGLEGMAEVFSRQAKQSLAAEEFMSAASQIEIGLMIRPSHQELRALSRSFQTQ